MSEIADRVRGIAVEKRYTHERIAGTLRISRTSVSARMNGEIAWTGPELLTLAAVWRVSPARFFPESTHLPEYVPVEAVAS